MMTLECELLPAYRELMVESLDDRYLIDGVPYDPVFRVSDRLDTEDDPALRRWIKDTILFHLRQVLADPYVLQDIRNAHRTEGLRAWLTRRIEEARNETNSSWRSTVDGAANLNGQLAHALNHGIPWSELEGPAGSALRFLADHELTLEFTGVAVWSAALQAAGTCDAVARDPWGRRVVVGWETGSPYWKMALQLGGYSRMLGEMTGEWPEQAVVVSLTPLSYMDFPLQDLFEAEAAFVRAIRLYREPVKW